MCTPLQNSRVCIVLEDSRHSNGRSAQWWMLRYTDLVGNALQARECEVGLVPILSVILLELIQVGSQQLAHKEEVLLQVHACAGQDKTKLVVC